MIEKYVSNELSLKRWKRFKRRKSASIASLLFIGLIVLSLLAPFIANNKPLYMKRNGKSYFPILKNYDVSDFDMSGSIIVDYRNISLTEKDTIIWPIIIWNPYEINEFVDSYPSKPTSKNIFGTDESGRDVFVRVLYGFQYSIAYAVLVWIFSFIIGIFLGALMGYTGGMVDLIGQRLVEIFSTVPQFFLLLILVSIFNPSLLMLVSISSIFGLDWY